MLFGNSNSDFGFLPSLNKADVQLFTPTGISLGGTSTIQTWIKPKGITMINMLCIGGGGGGAGGQSAAGNKGGGGGGGSGMFVSLMIPSIFIPDTLKILVGSSGRGGAAATAGNAGGGSYVSLGSGITGGTTNPNLIILANGGVGGSTANPGTGGAGANQIAVAAQGPLCKMGMLPGPAAALTGGQAGSNGGSSTTPAGINITGVWSAYPLSGGTGGAGATNATNGAGGSLTLQAAADFEGGGFYFPSNIINGGIAGGGNGNAGIKSLKPFLNTGGTGGGSVASGTGGIGGQGGYGCGGGGGGAGTTGGRGGDGGPGLVIITCW